MIEIKVKAYEEATVTARIVVAAGRGYAPRIIKRYYYRQITR